MTLEQFKEVKEFKEKLEKIEKPKEVHAFLRCPFGKDLCGKEECGLYILTYQRCCFVSIAKALDIITSIMDDRMGEPAT